jgi:hypothetical protein
MDPYQKRKVKGKNIQNTKWMDSGGFRLAFLFVIFFPEGKVINRSQSNLSNCVIEFNPVHSAHYFRPESRSSTRSLSRQSEHDSQALWTVKDSRSTAATPSLLSRGKRQSPHELLNSVIGDHIIFSESPTSPGVPIVLRPPEERMKNPERLNLDRFC